LKEILDFEQEGKNRAILIPEAKDLDIELVYMQLCAKMFVKGCYTSDNLYTPKTLPKEITFRLSKNESFEQVYNFYTVTSFLNPAILNTLTSQTDNKENKETNVETNPVTINVSQKKTQQEEVKKSSGPPKSVQRSMPSQPKKKPFEQAETAPTRNTETGEWRPAEVADERKLRATANNDDFRNPQPEEEQVVKNIKFKKDHFTLEPNPIMNLTHFQGFQSNGKNLLLTDDNSILYSCGNTICLMDVKSRLQRFFIGQKDSVSCLSAMSKQNVVVSIDDSDKNSKVYLWTMFPQTLQTSFFTGLCNVKCCDIAVKYENQRKCLILLVVGQDQLKRNIIAMYDITDFSYKEPSLFCKKISDFDIRSAKFLDRRDATQFVTCGKENIRFWRLKHKVINGTSVVLNEHGRDTVFSDFCVFDYDNLVNVGIPQETENRRYNYKILFCSNKGNVYLVDYREEVMLGVFKLHDGGINCLHLSPANHYFITSGEDKMVRLWNMDITQMLLEIKVDSQVNQLLLNKNDQIFCGCLNGTIGELKLDEKRMDFIVRSHSDSIIMMDYHRMAKCLITISKDFTIKIWKLNTGHIVQAYEFRCIDEQVLSLRCFHNSCNFICGFESGALRVFNIDQ